MSGLSNLYPLPSSHASQELPLCFQEEAVQQNDFIQIYPLSKGMHKIALKHVRYDLVLSDHYHFAPMAGRIEVPSLARAHSQSVQIELVPVQIGNKNRWVYELRSQAPFRLNHQWMRQAYLKRGDIVDFHHVRLIFKNHQKEIKQHIHHDLNKSMIQSHLPILLEGETGTGKSTLAKKIHEESLVEGHFVHLNLSSFSKNLLESELFGHCRGAFTGALREKLGALAKANRGTLFLDEIDSLSLELQVKLLLFLDHGTFTPVGSLQPSRIKTRIIAASGRKLRDLVQKGEMRTDFYHRITSGFTISTKPLREDHNQIHRVLKQFESKHSVVIDSSLFDHYKTLPWPGNLRQLLGHLDKKKVLSQSSRLTWDDSDDHLLLSEYKVLCHTNTVMTLQEMKKKYIQLMLRRTQGRIQEVAELVGVCENTVRKIAQAARRAEI